ncbi:hypothetical protein [Rhizobium herbae]|uniref:Uncharacterized protein n=1 Tax=Rhizobium herbae TaxID=508661 RepID=A0ABS4EVX5_9HYPH|nr:hypothetical protein [Rhizobium herbae]MBP1862105.1 hypothetical protein [Rhizobium herbae]
MVSTPRPSVRLDISFIKGVWMVTIFNGDQSENRSFRTEIDARDYGNARLEQLRSDVGEIRLNGKH